MKTKQMDLNATTTLSNLLNWGRLLSRLTIGVVMWPHGAQLLLGLFGGPGFSGAMGFLADDAGLPVWVSFLVIMMQFFGSIFIAAGFLTRITALGMAGMGLGMIFFGHAEHGFFMNWFGNQAGEGFEFHLLLVGLALSVFFNGPGKYSLDNKIVQSI